MSFWTKLGISGPGPLIDWEITPAATYGLFECRGDMTKVRSRAERYYYFYIDNWQQPATLCLMERGMRHARVLARVAAPQELIDSAVAEQGWACKEQNYSINRPLRQWLEERVLADKDLQLVLPATVEEPSWLAPATGLPGPDAPLPELSRVVLRSRPAFIREEEINDLVLAHNFFESRINPSGNFSKYLIDNLDNRTVSEQVTGLVWQRAGSGLLSHRKALAWCAERNKARFGNRDTWRLPTIEEALSLLTPEKNETGFYLHPCFSAEQGYILTGDRRKPGGHWFVDFRQATLFWAAGTTFGGGFVRLCADS
ncbi:MAG: DUF1566 domain-containing protein [Desulfobacterales bacterium]|nr:DUF1566 domain-containing protein [Desulfobacterales bacterium]